MNESKTEQAPTMMHIAKDRHQPEHSWKRGALLGLVLIAPVVYLQYGDVLLTGDITYTDSPSPEYFLIVEVGTFRAAIRWGTTN